jgi:hypothetical protein
MLWCVSSKTMRWDSQVALGLIDIFLLPEYYIPPSLALSFLITDTHSVLSKDLVLCICTSIFLKLNSVSSSHLSLDLHSFHPPAGLPSSTFLAVFYGIQVHAPVIKIKENTNKCTIYCIIKVFTVKTLTYFDPLWVFLRECRLCLKCDGTCAEIISHLSAKWTSPFKSAGASV